MSKVNSETKQPNKETKFICRKVFISTQVWQCLHLKLKTKDNKIDMKYNKCVRNIGNKISITFVIWLSKWTKIDICLQRPTLQKQDQNSCVGKFGKKNFRIGLGLICRIKLTKWLFHIPVTEFSCSFFGFPGTEYACYFPDRKYNVKWFLKWNRMGCSFILFTDIVLGTWFHLILIISLWWL